MAGSNTDKAIVDEIEFVDETLPHIPGIDDDRPPKGVSKRRSATSKRSPTATKSLTLPQLKSALSKQLTLLGLALSGFDSYDGSVILENADEIADNLVELAKVNDKVRRLLQKMMEGGAYAGIITVIGAKVALPIAVHHGLVPEPFNSALAAAQDIPVKDKRGNSDD